VGSTVALLPKYLVDLSHRAQRQFAGARESAAACRVYESRTDTYPRQSGGNTRHCPVRTGYFFL